MRVKHVPTDTETLVAEAATALAKLRSVDDLEQRMGVLKDRVGVANDRLAAFLVTMPEDYSAEDRAVFITYVSQTLEAIAEQAHEQVRFERTWKRLGE